MTSTQPTGAALRPAGRWQQLLLALVAGLLTALAFQPFNVWVLAPVGVASLTALVWQQSARRAALVGYVYGLGFLTLLVGWVQVIAFPVAVALIVVESLWFAVLAVLLLLSFRLPWWPAWAAGAWLLIEYGYSHLPFGGFGWFRIGFTSADSPLNGLLPFVGVSVVSYLTILVGQVLVWAMVGRPGPVRSSLARYPRALIAGIVVLTLAGLGLAGRGYQPAADPVAPVVVGMVQGNVDGVGLEAFGRQRSVTNNHLSETVTLMARARTGELPNPDFVLWPENSTDIDPGADRVTFDVVSTAAKVAQVPVLVGAVTYGPGPDERQTTAMWWTPSDEVTAIYHKRNLVPFGEWIPFRRQLLPLVPMLSRVGAQGVPGSSPGVLDVTIGEHGPVRVGVLICFELAYDETARQMLVGDDTTGGGAQLVTVQSNNATYAGTGQIAQQYAITRIRAMESRREIMVATTNALSGYIEADGTVSFETNERTSSNTAMAMPVRSTLTPAVKYGKGLELGLLIVTGLGLLVAFWRKR